MSKIIIGAFGFLAKRAVVAQRLPDTKAASNTRPDRALRIRAIFIA
jgi:hypothetical protein